MLRISQLHPDQDGITLRLEGAVAGAWVAELQQSCQAALAQGQPLNLHLGEVEFIDTHGVALLCGLRAQGVSLLDCSPYVTEQLKVLSVWSRP